MGKTIFAAVVAAVLASIATVLIMNSFQAEQRAADAAERKSAEETAKVERERLDRRVAEIEKRGPAAPRAPRRSEDPAPAAETSAPGRPAGDAPSALAPDGTPYVSRAELQEELKKAEAGAGQRGLKIEPFKPTPKKSLEDVAREMGLSAGEEASLRNILRSTEEELVRSLFGDRPIDDIKRDVVEAKDDPDKKAALVQSTIMNAIPNIGRLATMRDRVRKQVESVLGPERAGKFLAQPLKPVLDPEFEEFTKGF